ncbi:MAG: lysophospholipid acyltransferase family protein [Thermomicrobiales bacterium]|nr:lysophospholipid acyltransferase family protein [Thermomicrobiales bacterium]
MTRSDDPASEPRPPMIQRSHLPRIEFRKSQRRDLTFYLAAEFAAVLSWLVRLTPDGLVDFIARRIGDLTYFRSKQWRANVESNLSHVLDLPSDAARIRRTARMVFQSNALNVATLLRSPHQGQNEFLRHLKLTRCGWDVLDDAMARKQGVIILTAHLGSFDTMGSAMRIRGYPMAALTARTTNRFAFEFVSFLRQSHNLELIEASSSGVREAISHLRAGKMLCLLSDRDFFLNGREIEFFGERTTLPIGAVRMARDTGASIVPVFIIRQGRQHMLMIEPAFTVEKTDDRNADIDLGMQRVVRTLENAIGLAPEQWVMFQRVWPEKPEALRR